ncbi:hypothetical protein HAZT_HAZT005057 [Hyalella azteca]|uniref:Cell growth-regulating nucleolar protein n=1 Tax=Hyalella azteca TaxID=294128 RepID=A0A6A0GQV7_HYAAZ|nr:cell growth-regulating nucleolar protein [Hyalella azteca]KAA0183553.1 hypothetical protein HAZT_HAZT005057 [Hyalella azteca]
MVFFVCSACGSSFKSKQAKMHTFRCRDSAFSCMDCGKEFQGYSFTEHTQCITESEKYHGSHHVPKTSLDKNALWVEKVKNHLNKQETKPFLKKMVGKMLEMPNIPRKEKKFMNFVRTNLNVSSEQIVQGLWELVSGAMAVADNASAENVADKENSSAVQNGQNLEEKVTNGVADDMQMKEQKTQSLQKNPETDHSSLPDETSHKSKKRKVSFDGDSLAATNSPSDEHEEDEEVSSEPRESKSKRRKKNKGRQSATDEPDDSIMCRPTHGGSRGEDLANLESVSVDAVTGLKAFKWRSSLKRILRAGPAEGMKLTKLLHKIEQEYNDPVTGAAIPLSRDELRSIMMKTLNKKPFSVLHDRAKVGKFNTTVDEV